jgi:hypothetical protein
MKTAMPALILACASSFAFADEAYNNLGPCHGVDSFSGTLVVFPSLLFGTHTDSAAQFTAAASGNATTVRLPITSVLGPDFVTLRLFADAGGGVGAQVGSDVPFFVTDGGGLYATPLVFIDVSEAAWTMVAGQKYWLGITAPMESTALLTVWENTTGDTGTLVFYNDGVILPEDYSPDSAMPAMAIDVGPTSPCVAPGILTHPSPTSICPHGSATFSISADGTTPNIPQWQVHLSPEDGGDWANLGDGHLVVSDVTGPGNLQAGVVTCAGGMSMTFAPSAVFSKGFVGGQVEFRCIVTNACGSVISNPATLTICVADIDDGTGTGTCDGGVTIDDLIYYLGVFEQGVVAADVDDGSGAGIPDGGVTIDDLIYFLTRLESGC